MTRGTRHGWKAAAGAAAWLALMAGCSASQTRIVLPEELPFAALEASREELLAKLQAGGGRFDTIRATVNYLASGDLRGESGDVRQRTYDPVRGGLIVERPSRIRMNGNTTLGLISAFDMSSDGVEFRLSVPAQGKFYHGPNEGRIEGAEDNPLLQLRPHHVLQALFVDVREYLADSRVVRSFAEVSEGRRRFYVFSFIDAAGPDGRLRERIWIDRRNLEVARKQLFTDDGVLELQVDYDDHGTIDDLAFPRRVAIERPIEGASLEIEFLEASLDEDIAQALFVLPYPSGAESIRVGDTDVRPTGSGDSVVGVAPGAPPNAAR